MVDPIHNNMQQQKILPPYYLLKKLRIFNRVWGGLLYYERAIDGSILPALNSISKQQTQPTETTKEKLHQLLDYLVTYPDVILRYYASDMILKVDSDSAYLVLPKVRSRIAGYFRIENKEKQLKETRPNGTILIE